MNPIVFAGFILGGWNLASAYSVGKDTQSGKMPGPKSFGYTLAALLGVTGATLGYYSMKAQENPKLLAADYDGEGTAKICVRCNGLGDLCRGCSGLGADYPEEFGSCDLPPFPCPYCDTTGKATVNENMELVRKGFGDMMSYFDRANQELFGPKYLFAMKDNPKEDYEHPWIQLDDAKAAKLFDWIEEKYGIPPEFSQDLWENTPYKYKQEYDFPSEADSTKATMERYKIDYPELFEKNAESWQGISLAGTVDEIEEMLGRKKEAESKTFDPKHYNDLLAGKVNSEIKESMREEGWPEDEINLMYAIPHSSYAGFIPEVQARELFDEIHKFNDPANQELYESESQTFEAPTPYTNADQEAFTKSYSRKAKNPWSQINKKC